MKNKARHIDQVPPDKGHSIAGFVDGEGSFFISARKRNDYPSKWKFGLHFNVSNNDIVVLEVCKKYLGCGVIRKSKPKFYTLEVQSRNTLKDFVIPFFRKYKFLSNKKKEEFRVFQEAFNLLETKIQTETDLEKFLQLRLKLNKFRKTRITNTDQIIYQSFIFMEKSSETLR
jgi:hypothetical protein